MDARVSRLLALAVAGVASVAISGCMDSSDSGGGSASNPPPPAADDPTVIPVSAGASGAAFVSYTGAMPAEEVADESRTFAPGFADPDEDGDEPTPVS